MSDNHGFCRMLLQLAREEAKKLGVDIPKNITALKSLGDQYFIEADGMDFDAGVFISGDCAYDAKARFIAALIQKAKPSNPEEL